MWLASFLLIVTSLPGAPPQIADVVAAHESAIALIEKFDLVVEVRNLELDGKVFDPPLEMIRARWSHEDMRERTRIKQSFPRDMSKAPSPRPGRSEDAPGNHDFFTDGITDRRLEGWDPSLKGKIDPWDSKGVRALMANAVPGKYNTYYSLGSVFTLTKISARSFEQQRSLKEFVKASPHVDLQMVADKGVQCPKLVMQHPDTATKGKFKDTVISAIIDPQTYMVREIDIELPKSALGLQSSQVYRVDKFQKFENGASLPARVLVTSTYEGGRGIVEFKLVLAESTVNKELPKDALDFQFPEGALVRDMSTLHGGSVTAHIWGPDNKPIRSLKDMSELGPPPSDAAAYQARKRWLTYGLYGVAVPGVVALLFFLFWRRRS